MEYNVGLLSRKVLDSDDFSMVSHKQEKLTFAEKQQMNMNSFKYHKH